MDKNWLIYKGVSFGCSLFFFFILYKLYKYFFGNIEGEQVDGDEKYFKYDLLIASLLYCFFTILFFYPCLKTITTSLIGPPSDNMNYFWNIWWGHKVFTESDKSLAFSTYLLYPEGTSLLFHAGFYNLFLSIILRQFLSPVIVYNLLILHTFVLSGIGAFLLIKYLSRNSYFSLIGAFIFAFNPSHFAHSLYLIEISSIQFIPVFILYFIKTLKDNAKKNLFLACLFFLMNSLCNWYYLIFAVYFMVFSYAYLIYRKRRFILSDILLKMSIIIGTTLLIFSPWLSEMVALGMALGLRHPELNYIGHDSFVVDAFALFVPPIYHRLGDNINILNINKRFTGPPWEVIAYLGTINIFIVLFAFKGTIKKTAKYFCGFFAFLVLAMGAHIRALGWRTPVMLPYKIIKCIPFLSYARCPARIIVYAYLFLAIVVTFALKYLFNTYKYKSRKRAGCLLALLVLLLFFDYYSVCHTMTKVYLPPAYNVIEAEDKVFGILDLPACDYRDSQRYMMYQTYHGFPIVQGRVSRKTSKSLQDYLALKDLTKQKRQLISNNVKYIVIHKKAFSNRIFERSAIVMDIDKYQKHYENIYEDEGNIVFKVY